VEGYVTTSIALEDFNATVRQKFRRGENILRMRIPPHSDDRRVLKQQKRVSDATFFAQCDQLLLESYARRVINGAELEDGDHPSFQFCVDWPFA